MIGSRAIKMARRGSGAPRRSLDRPTPPGLDDQIRPVPGASLTGGGMVVGGVMTGTAGKMARGRSHLSNGPQRRRGY